MKRENKVFIIMLIVMLMTLVVYGCADSSVVYKINFDAGEGVFHTISTDGKSAITLPDIPTKAGYTFDGWYWDNNEVTPNSLVDKPIKRNITVYAKWTPNSVETTTYTITFNANGGSAVAAITKEAGVSITAPTAPTKDNHTFGGWYTDNNTFNNAYTFSTMPAQNLELFAKWTADPQITTYTITFNSNDGSAVAAITKEAGVSITAPTAPTKDDHTFGGWYTDNNTFNNAYTFSTMPAQNLELFAKWTADPQITTYTITFNSNGGSAVAAITKEAGASITAPTAPTKDNHTFGGWYTDNNTFNNAYTFSTMPAQSFELFAKWTADPQITTYTITFNSNGGSAVAAITKEAGASITAPTAPTKDNHTFGGWYTDNNTFNNAYTFSTMPAQSFELFAKWTADPQITTYTITFNSNGGSAVAAITKEAGASITAPTAPTKDNHTFGGWYTDNNTFNNAYTFSTMPAQSFELFAKWTADPQITTYTITFNSNGGSAVVAITKEAGASITAPTTPTKDDHTFGGWYTDNNTFNNAYTFSTMPAQNLELFAKWTPVDVLESLWLGMKDLFLEIWEDAFEEENEATIVDVEVGENLEARALRVGGAFLFFEATEETIDVILSLVLNTEDGANYVRMGDSYIFVAKMLSADKILADDIVKEEDTYFDSQKSHIVRYVGRDMSYTIPDTVTSIGYAAFVNCEDLKSVTIPLAVTEISAGAFIDCENLFIYAETVFALEGWNENWNPYNYPTVWGYNLEHITYSFDTNGGSPVENIVVIRIEDSPYTEQEGLYFAGWYDNEELEGEPVSFPYYSDTKTTLYASWSDTIVLDGKSMETAFVATVDQEITVTLKFSYEGVYYSFAPLTSGYYVIKSYGFADAYVDLYDSLGNHIRGNDDSENSSNFRLKIYLEAEELYYLHMGVYDSNKTFVFDIIEEELIGDSLENVWIISTDIVYDFYGGDYEEEKVYFAFTPTQNGIYYFDFSRGYCVLADSEYNEVNSGYQGFFAELQKEQDYYILIQTNSERLHTLEIFEYAETQLDTLWAASKDLFGEVWQDVLGSEINYMITYLEIRGYRVKMLSVEEIPLIIECSEESIDATITEMEKNNMQCYRLDNSFLLVFDIFSFNYIVADEILKEDGNYFNTDKTAIIRYNGSEEVYTIPEGVTHIGSFAFIGSNLEIVIIPNYVTSLSSNAFNYMYAYIYAQSEVQPEGWHEDWNPQENPVTWGYNMQEVTYHFVSNGGTEIESYTGIHIEEAPYIEKEGFFFWGWYGREDCEGTPVTFPYYSNTATTLYAKWGSTLMLDGKSFETAYVAEENTIQTVQTTYWSERIHYLFVPTNSAHYSIQSYGNTNTYIVLCDSHYWEYANSSEGGEGDNFKYIGYFEEGQVYYLLIGCYEESQVFEFDITEYQPQAGEVFETAIQLQLDTDTDALVSTQKLYYTFVAQTTGVYIVRVEDNNEVNITIFNNGYDSIGKNSGELRVDVYEGETYYIELSTYGWTGDITFILEEYELLAGESFSMALTLDLNTLTDLTIVDYNQKVYYVLEIENAGIYVIRLIDNDSMSMFIYDCYQQEFASGNNFIKIELYDNGTYYLVLEANWWQGELTFIVEEYEPEAGENFDLAIEVQLDEEYVVPILLYTQEVHYVFVPPISGYYAIQINCDSEAEINIFNRDWFYVTGTADEGSFYLYFELLDYDTYYIVINVSNDNGFSTLEVVEYIPQEGETFDNAIEAEIELMINTTISFYGQSIIYRFVPQTSGYYVVQSYGDSDTQITLFDNYTNFLKYSDDEGVDNNFRLKYALEEGNVYYLMVRSSRGKEFDFDINIYEPEAGEFFETAIPTQLDTEYVVEFMSYGQDVIYSFVPADSCYYLIQSYGKNNPNLTIYDSNQWYVGYNSNGKENNFYISIYLQEGETYYFAINAYMDIATSFDVTVYEPEAGETFGTAILTEMGATELSISNYGKEIYYLFIPEETAKYVFYSDSYSEMEVYLYDSYKNQIAYNYGWGYSFEGILTKGDNYYLSLRVYNGDTEILFVIEEGELLPGETFESAILIQLDTDNSYQQYEYEGEVFFKFVPLETSAYTLVFSGAYVSLYDSEKDFINWGDEMMTVELNANETYFFQFQTYAEWVTFRIEKQIY